MIFGTQLCKWILIILVNLLRCLPGDVMLTSLKSCRSPCTWHCHHAAERDARFYVSRDVATQFARFESGRLQRYPSREGLSFRSQIHDVKELKKRLLSQWRLLDHTITAAIAQWRSPLNACVRVNGGHFKHKFWAFDFLLRLFVSSILVSVNVIDINMCKVLKLCEMCYFCVWHFHTVW